MSNKLYCIAVYPMNDYFVVRKCCSESYSWHFLEPAAIDRLPQCNCEIVATELTREEALQIGLQLSKELDIPLDNKIQYN